jgi:hypothetical protein
MERLQRDSVARGVACAAALAAFAALREALGFDPAFLAVFAIGLLTAFVEGPRGGEGGRPRSGVLEGLAARLGGGLLAVLALATVCWTRYGTLAAGSMSEVLENVVAASLAAALLMRLPLLVALGNQPLVDGD